VPEVKTLHSGGNSKRRLARARALPDTVGTKPEGANTVLKITFYNIL